MRSRIANTITISELQAYSVLGVIVLLFFIPAVMIIFRSTALYHNAHQIRDLKTQLLLTESQLAVVEKKWLLHTVLQKHRRLNLDEATRRKIVDIVYENSQRYGYDPLIVLAVIAVESVFDPKALGRYRSGRESGAYGLMQLKLQTAIQVGKEVGIEVTSKADLFDPNRNIALGIAYLTQQITRFGSLKLGILAYNQGPGTIRSNLRDGKRLSVRYYEKVMRYYRQFQQIIDQQP